MLERIREGSQGPWAMAIIALIVLSFVFAGVGSYLTSSGSTAVATVNGEEISAQELERAYQNQRAQMESQFGESIAQLFSSEQYLSDFKRNVLDRLIAEKLIQQEAVALGLRVSDEQIKETITQMPEFQFGGQFDNQRFQTILRQNGFQVADFRDYLRTQMTQNQLAAALTNSAFALEGEVELANTLQGQTRDANYLVIDSASFSEGVEVTEDDINAYYNANIAAFDTEEQVKLAYVMLSIDDLKSRVSVDDDEVRSYYENNLAGYQTEEERRVSHILIEFGDDTEAARAKAEALLAEIKAGADFATLAETSSEDSFSAEAGGDLDYITQDAMDPAFDEAAFAIENVGEVSDVVESEFGFHIIKLTDIKPSTTTAFEDVKSDIRESLLLDKATEAYFEDQNLMAEIAFEVPDTLEDVANAVDATVQETALFSRNMAPTALDYPAVLEAAFSSELIEEGVNSDIIEIDDETVVVVRVVEHEPQRTQSLEEVREGIVASLQDQKAQEAAQAWARERVNQLQKGESIDDALAEKSLNWEAAEGIARSGSTVNRAIVDKMFTLALGEGSQYDYVSLVSGDVAIVELTHVNPAPALEESVASTLKQRLSAMHGQRVYQQFVEGLRADADVTISPSL
ncbi:SurA N-terminal domain-containing protein [Alteromonas sp. B31-7]|uniref:SurA N-terminal domain-containing protein n=1 Tax=Alteromonas sp. B31-7 TaxID=2785913 RepID=UPI0018C989DC|nr:SurA N-terminal domain-containing protein [Alteromonas sp. B31-7]QPL51233.1 SurA N-terminal domain-containing protein [Alteromonas sp. B31-7]